MTEPTQADREAAESIAAQICGCAEPHQRKRDVKLLLEYRITSTAALAKRVETLEAENAKLREALLEVRAIVEDEPYKVTVGQKPCRHTDAINEIYSVVEAALGGQHEA